MSAAQSTRDDDHDCNSPELSRTARAFSHALRLKVIARQNRFPYYPDD
jgi:hypothetical protein